MGRTSRRPGAFASRVGFNGLAQMAPIVASLALTPLLIHRLGSDRFGVWSLAVIALGTLTSLDGGLSASLARFFAIYTARDDRRDAGRLLAGSFLLFLCLGGVLALLAAAFAPTFVSLVNVPAALDHEAIWIFRWLPLLTVAALVADASAALLQGNGQFRELAITTAVSATTFAIAVVILVQPGAHLRVLVAAAGIRYAAMAVVGFFFARKHVTLGRPLFPSWRVTREVGSYASRMQLASLTGFVNAELDGFVIAAVSPVRYVGLYSVGLQAASAARSVPLYAFSPLLTRLTTTFRQRGRQAAALEFEVLERSWVPWVFGFGIVAVAAIAVSVRVWLGRGYLLSGVTAAVLLTGYVVHVALTGVRTCYVRAVGRPGLEARYSLVWTICNAALTVPLALAAGMVGVVAATAGTGIVASVYFVALCRRTEQLPVVVPDRGRWLTIGAAALVTAVAEVGVLETGVHGFAGLALSGVPPLVVLAVLARREWRRTRVAAPDALAGPDPQLTYPP